MLGWDPSCWTGIRVPGWDLGCWSGCWSALTFHHLLPLLSRCLSLLLSWPGCLVATLVTAGLGIRLLGWLLGCSHLSPLATSQLTVFLGPRLPGWDWAASNGPQDLGTIGRPQTVGPQITGLDCWAGPGGIRMLIWDLGFQDTILGQGQVFSPPLWVWLGFSSATSCLLGFYSATPLLSVCLACGWCQAGLLTLGFQASKGGQLHSVQQIALAAPLSFLFLLLFFTTPLLFISPIFCLSLCFYSFLSSSPTIFS